MGEGQRFAVGVDIGGTFTDCVGIDQDGRTHTGKVSTTPHDRSLGFFASIDEVAHKFGVSTPDLLARTTRLVHGTTTGTNALVSRTGARVGLLATAGHGDALHIMKGGGRTFGLSPEHLIDLASGRRPEEFVPRRLVCEVIERIDSDGEVVVALDEAKARESIRSLLDQDVEAIAISLLWSPKNPAHEHRVRELVAEMAPDVFVACGADLTGRLGEYERTTTCVMNAYIGPLMVRYVEAIEQRARSLGYSGTVLFAQCGGGAMTADEVRRAPILTVQSGPVAGVTNSVLFGHAVGEPHLLTTDMGGTTFDVSVIRHHEPLARELATFQRFEMALPMLDVESVGAGGGSIAWIDDSNRLNVGPRSAGADPGPACYGRGGTEPTVTDADVVLGVIDPTTFLHRELSLDVDAATNAIEGLANELGMGTYEAAAGINSIVDANMADLIRRMSEHRGLDPRTFTMLAFGGGGPVHAAACARAARVPKVIIALPEVAPVWSAGGAANADVTHLYTTPLVLDLPAAPDVIERTFVAMERDAWVTLTNEGFGERTIRLQRSLRMKHRLQVYDVAVPVDFRVEAAEHVDRIDQRFTTVYEERYGRNSGYRAGGIQITAFQLRATGVTDKAPFVDAASSRSGAVTARQVYWQEHQQFIETPVLEISGGRGERVDGVMPGPHLIQLPDTVVVIRPGQKAAFDDSGNIVIDTSARAS